MFGFLKPKKMNDEKNLLLTLYAKRDQIKSNRNLLFLDYDGVFMSTSADPKVLMKNIMSLVDEFDFKIVISSSWRMNPQMALDTLRKMGCDAEVVGMTAMESGPRYLEIAHYLMKHAFHQFLILDDLDMGPLRDHAIKTEFRRGFDALMLKEARNRFYKLLKQSQ